jgi:hypothetical protein
VTFGRPADVAGSPAATAAAATVRAATFLHTVLVSGLILLASGLSGCASPLPEEGSSDAQLYVARCGTCHRAHQPRALTASMWKVQVDRMDAKYRAARIPGPTPAERAQILAYLTRHAGG